MSSSASTSTETNTSQFFSTGSVVDSPNCSFRRHWRFVALLRFCRDHVGPEGKLIAFGVESTGAYASDWRRSRAVTA